MLFNKQGYFWHFNEVTFGIKFLYGGAGRGYGGGGRIRHIFGVKSLDGPKSL